MFVPSLASSLLFWISAALVTRSESSLRGAQRPEQPPVWRDCLGKVKHTTQDSPGVMEEHPELTVLQEGDADFLGAFEGISIGEQANNETAFVFGDNGCDDPDLGGIRNWEVVRVEQPLKLYAVKGANAEGQADVTDPWFADAAAIDRSFVSYSNDAVAICWDWTFWVECTVNPQVTLIVGQGGPRDTLKTFSKTSLPCDMAPTYASCDFQGDNLNSTACPIVQRQECEPALLQYIIKPAAWKMSCNVCKRNTALLKNSSGCVPVVVR